MFANFSHDEEPVLHVQNLAVKATHPGALKDAYGEKNILRDISFHMHSGERIAIIGTSGSGKTSLLKAIAGVLPQGWQVSGAVHANQKELAYIMQEPKGALNPIRTVRSMFSTLRYSTRHGHGVARRGRTITEERIKKNMQDAFSAMNLVRSTDADDPHAPQNLARLLSKRRAHISGGMAQRIMVALAVATGAHIALADEVSSALDEAHERKTIELLLSTMQGVLFVTHRMNLIKDYCHKVLMLKNGVRHFFGTVEAFLNVQDDPAICALVDAGQAEESAATHAHKHARVVGNTRRHSQVRESVLHCERVFVSYERPSLMRRALRKGNAFVLKDLTFSARAGEVVFICGETGCGKSTFAHLCTGDIRPCSGIVRVNNTPMPYGFTRTMRIFRRGVQLISQVPSLSFNPLRTVHSSIKDAQANMSVHEKKESEEYLRHLCATMHISDTLLTRFPQQLSGGQLQRFAIIRALLPHPKVIIFDEPVSHLDPYIRLQVLKLIAAVHAETGITLIVISHLDDVSAFIRRHYPQCVHYTLEHGVLVAT